MDESEDWYIRVAGHVKGNFLLIEVENSYEGNGMVRTGTGLSNIKAVTEKYHGAMNIKTEGKAFVFHALLIISQHSENIP